MWQQKSYISEKDTWDYQLGSFGKAENCGSWYLKKILDGASCREKRLSIFFVYDKVVVNPIIVPWKSWWLTQTWTHSRIWQLWLNDWCLKLVFWQQWRTTQLTEELVRLSSLFCNGRMFIVNLLMSVRKMSLSLCMKSMKNEQVNYPWIAYSFFPCGWIYWSCSSKLGQFVTEWFTG